MNRNRIVMLVVVLIMVSTLSVFAAGSTEPAKTAAPAPTPAAAPAAMTAPIAAPATPTTINLIGWAFPITEFYQSKFRELNSIPNLTVNTQLMDSAGAQEQVRLALSGGQKSPYQIVHGANAQISEWGYSGWLAPLDDLVKKYWDKYDLGDIPQTAWEAASVNGKIMGVPAVANSFLLIYRDDLFKKYNISIPKNYDEVIAAATKLKAEPGIEVPFIISLHAGWAWEIEFFQFLGGFGGKFLNNDNTPAFNSPAGVKALEKLVQVAKEGVGQVGLSYSIDNMEVGLQTGRVAFANTWASRAVKMNNPEFSDYVKELKFAVSPSPMAGGKAGASAWNDFYCIPATSEVDRELVFQVIMEAVKFSNQVEALKHGVPTRAKALSSESAAVYMPATMAGLQQGIGGYQNTPGVPLVRKILGQVLPTVMTGKETPQQVLDKAAAQYVQEAKAQGILK